MEPEVETLGDLLAPLSTEDFFRDYWEKTFLHLRGQPDRFSRYFSLRDVDRWMTSVRSGLPDSIMITAPEGAEARTDRYSPQGISLEAAYASLARGCSIVLNHMEDWPSLQGLVKALGRELHADIGVNAYLTPKGARTFPIHSDEHDTLILHLEGEKVWRLHEFSLLHIRLSQKKNLKFSEEWYGRTQTPELAEIRLRPGDILYMPRGMPHYAVAQGSACLHLTFSITSLYWMDFLKIAAEHAAVHAQELRRALPPGFVDNEEICERMRETYQEVLKKFLEVTSFDEVLAAVKRNRATFQGYPSDGHFAQLLDLDELSVDSEVERRRDVLCVVDEIFDTERNPKSAIMFAAQQVTGPLFLFPALEFIRDQPRFRVSEIPGLDEKGQLTLVRRLIREGLLRPVAAPTPVEVPEPALP
jgi:ribosomal protein L16 Arg81 hydroxylase